tara:strand:- start:118 stop:378 length:261 start_codon:yes stop_codon:yes gene_type:complete
MNNRTNTTEHIRPMLAAMARSIEAARAKRSTPDTTCTVSGSSEGTTSLGANYKIGNPNAENGKPKAKAQTATGSFFRDRGEYRKAG